MSSKEYFDNVASRWDAMRQNFFSEAVRNSAFQAAGLQPKKTAVDVGAGSGFITEGLLKSGLEVIAVDQSQQMLTALQQKFSRADCRVGQSENLPVDDASADYVFANMFLHHVERPGRSIKEMARILKNGGMLVITDLDEHDFDFLRHEHHDRWMGFKRSDLETWLSEAGLSAVQVSNAGQNCCTCSEDGSRDAAISIFIASGRKIENALAPQIDSAAKSAAARSREFFDSGYLCAESVLAAVAEQCGIQSNMIPAIATGFCGGMSRSGGLCGAMTGGILSLNLLFGRNRPDQSRDKNYALVDYFIKEFEAKFGSTNCTRLLGCDISTPEGTAEFNDKKLGKTFCADVTEQAAGLVMTVIQAQDRIKHPLI